MLKFPTARADAPVQSALASHNSTLFVDSEYTMDYLFLKNELYGHDMLSILSLVKLPALMSALLFKLEVA